MHMRNLNTQNFALNKEVTISSEFAEVSDVGCSAPGKYHLHFEMRRGAINGKDIILGKAVSRVSTSPELDENYTCYFTERTYQYAAEDWFTCGDAKPLFVDFFANSSVVPLSEGSSSFSVITECSLGSLWQQFACRYLGQSKYDENGNLKPEARRELGIEN